MAIFKGAGVAIVTPMKENQEVNYEKLEELIEFQIENGTDCACNRRNNRREFHTFHGRTQKSH